MIRQQTGNIAFLAAIIFVLTACGESGSGDYCDNHYEFHASHIDSVVELSIELSEEGALGGRLLVPKSALDDTTLSGIETLLASTEKTFSLQSQVPCDISVTNLNWVNDILDVRYAASCGADNKIGKIDVTLFDHIDGLEEVVTSVTTPATAKRFGISRQCDAPIFRVD